MHDLIGIGIGPFNLGLAALAAPVDDLDAVLFDRRPAFDWHPGLMVPDARVQVPFLADLVTMADPTSRYGFLNYLHTHGRLYRFYFREDMHPLRREFQAYCRWVADALPSCCFGVSVEGVARDGGVWVVTTRDAAGDVAEHRARQVVLGVGTAPAVPRCAEGLEGPDVLHSAAYLAQRERLRALGSVAVIGSGQSAAEVVADLLDGGIRDLAWYTRGDGFLPMEYSKLGLELFSPEYVDHFHGLPADRRDAIRAGQDLLYKGISADTSAQIFDRLYERSVDGGDVDGIDYRPRCELTGLERDPAGGVRLRLTNLDDGRGFERHAGAVVLGTGYRDAPWPAFDASARVETDDAGRPVVDRDYRVRVAGDGAGTLFVQNAELHTHGVGTPDLGLAAHRNSVIINAVAGREVYPVRRRNVFQRFGAPR